MRKCICDLPRNASTPMVENNWIEVNIFRDDYYYYIEGIGDSKVNCKINYCPKCGRKLN